MRMEKADILENVVKFLQTKQQQNTGPSTSCPSPASCDAQYRLGYLHCVREVRQIMGHLCGANSQLTLSLSHYLNAKVTQMTTSHHPFASSLPHERLRATTQGHTSPLASMYKADDIPNLLRTYPECTSATGVPPASVNATTTSPEQRVPPVTPSAHSAFHKVQPSQQQAPVHKSPSSDAISIAVYQYNHYNNYRNDKATTKSGANESSIDIRPVIKVEAQSSSQGTSANSSLNSTGESSDLDRHLQGQMDESFLRHHEDEDSDMWRPW